MSDQSPLLKTPSPLAGPGINQKFLNNLNELVKLTHQGHHSDSEVYNPSDEWLIDQMPILEDLPKSEQASILLEVSELERISREANSQGKAAYKVWPEAVVRLDNGGLDFFSQLGVVRRPDLTQYFVDGFDANRDGIAFNEANQELFSEVFEYICATMRSHLSDGTTRQAL